jgi:hypothetical protein
MFHHGTPRRSTDPVGQVVSPLHHDGRAGHDVSTRKISVDAPAPGTSGPLSAQDACREHEWLIVAVVGPVGLRSG